MSGHSKWATTKRAKAANDAKRGAIFTKLANTITIAARDKGGDISSNFTLRMAIDKAKAANMPKDNIDRAIKRGTGELDGAQIEELIYEGIGPANTQFIVKCLTDNKNRSAAEVRHAFTKHGGSFGSVMWNFEKKGVVRVEEDKAKVKELELELIDYGAQDIIEQEDCVEIYTQIEDLQKLKDFLEQKSINTESAEMEYIAKDSVKLSDEDKEKVEKFFESLEDMEDVSDFYTNANL